VDVAVVDPVNFVEYFDVGGWLSLSFGVDGLSLVLLLLTAYIFPLTFLYCWYNVAHRGGIATYLILLEIFLVVAF
jgi:NADH:ubiquinone oxidoreductase subunit 4 (subunit M)